MQKISRHKTRKCLFQALYSKTCLYDTFDKDIFISSFFEENFSETIDQVYFDELFT
jgi:hypothetical protein